MIVLRKICPVCRTKNMLLTLGCFHRRTVELECESCHSRSVSRIPTAAWWLHRTVFAFISTLLVPILFLFFLGKWAVWVGALLLLSVLGGASYFLLHIANCNRMLRGNQEPGVSDGT